MTQSSSSCAERECVLITTEIFQIFVVWIVVWIIDLRTLLSLVGHATILGTLVLCA